MERNGLKMQIPAADREYYLTKILHNTQEVSHTHIQKNMLSLLIAEEKSAAGKEAVCSFTEMKLTLHNHPQDDVYVYSQTVFTVVC